MRSKVKRLVEKPDKDPAKLPRTEKETEMVSLHEFLEGHEDDASSLLLDLDPHLDLSVPSPPKALKRPDIEALKERALREEEDMLRRLTGGLSRSPSTMSRLSGSFSKSSRCDTEASLQRSTSLFSQANPFRPVSVRLPMLRESPSLEALMPSSSMSPSITPTPRVSGESLGTAGHRKRGTPAPSIASTTKSRTPFFNPSELDEIMQPIKEEFSQKHTDEIAQAKAAYDQLNEQLTQELPQLIDLR